MALMVTIEKTGEIGSPYTLKVEEITHAMVRMPTQSGLPGDTDNNQVNVFGIDLGMCVEQISLTGLIEETDAEAGEPTKKNLETAVRNWWSEECNDIDTCTNGVGLTIDSTETYWGAFKGCTFRKMGGIEDRWNFSLEFIVIGRV